MELNINSPAYFKDFYGIDDEVYRYCQRLYMYFMDKKYSDDLKIIGISPIVAPEEIYNSGKWKESVKIIGNGECASVVIHMDFDAYYNADSAGKILLTKETIKKAIMRIKRRSKINCNSFIEDLDNISKEFE